MSAATPLAPVLWLPGNHLYPPAQLKPYRGHRLVMVEDEGFCRRHRYHQQKLALLLSAMREHAEALRGKGFDVEYHRLDAGKRVFDTLQRALGPDTPLHTFRINDHGLRRRIARFCDATGSTWHEGDNPGFLTSDADLDNDLGSGKRLLMAKFYQRQRLRLELMVDEHGKPDGGKWSFDADNRKKVPAKQALPELPQVKHGDATRSAIDTVRKRFADNPGDAHELWLPTTRRGALAWLKRFLAERLTGFGTYEDAITTRSPFVFHSTLSPLLNLGLLTPDEVIAATQAFVTEHDVAINDVEGFVRQIVGWREFIRGVYERVPDMGQCNVRNHHRGLTQHWFDATTGIPPLDLAIRTHQRWGWNHHIERLMVLANLMNLCEIEPQAVYRYFMQHHIDAYDWVMTPNVYGMGLTSEGGTFATKPYIAGSNYLLKMSDIKKGDWCDVVDGLYWRFVANNREELSKNPRLAAFASGLDRLKPARRERIFAAAEGFLERCTTVGA